MVEGRYVSVQFCDDIRQEVGNKYSLIGCYGPSMLVGAFPVLLPKLCAFLRIYTPISRPFARVSMRILRGDQSLTEMEIPQQALENIRGGQQLQDATLIIVGSALVMSPFPVEEPTMLRVEVETEDGVLSGGKFRIEKVPAPVEKVN